jgi:P27 family predicted phage terminase small subunit
MGKRGTKPLPTNLKVVKGTLRKSRQVKNELKTRLLTRLPNPPDWVCEKGKMEWARQIKELDKMGLIAECDLVMFAMYCDVVGMYQDAKEKVQQKGDVYTGSNGGLLENPYNYMIERYRKAALQMATQFGFTPSSRTGISVSKKQDDDPFATLIKKAT